MKIVHIITRLVLGGAQENTLITCRELAKRGHDVTLITGPALGPEGQLFDQTKGQGYKIIFVDKLIRSIKPTYDLASYRQIKKHLKNLQPDIVHTHSAKAGILGRFAAGKLRKHNRTGRPGIVHTIHGLAFHPYQKSLLNRFYISIEKRAAKRTDFFISVADAMTRQALEAGIAAPDKYITAYSAIDEEAFLRPISTEKQKQFRKKYGIRDKDLVLVTIARLFKLKGHEYIIESAHRLAAGCPNAVWLFVGGGNLEAKFKSRVRKLGLENRIKFTGLLPPGEIPMVLQSSDILVHCSLREGLARALPQAMLCGRPVISFDVDGAGEIVNEKTGRLIEPENVEELTKACMALIENPRLREELGAAARQFVTEKFRPDKMVDTIEGVYEKILKPKSSM